MKQILLSFFLTFSLLHAQENCDIPTFLQPHTYDQITREWVNTYIINNTHTLISPDDMHILLNALYVSIEWICYEQEANRYFAQAGSTFSKVKNLVPSGVADVYELNEQMQILAQYLSFCITNKQKAHRAQQSYARLESRLMNQPLAPIWYALGHEQAAIGQDLLAYDIAISKKYLHTAQEEIAPSLAVIHDAQDFMEELATTVNQTTIDNLVEVQNGLINQIHDDIDETIDNTNQTLFALESLQAHSTHLERSLYKTILYAYYQALYNAMKANNVSSEYFTLVDTQGEILIYLPEPSLMQ